MLAGLSTRLNVVCIVPERKADGITTCPLSYSGFRCNCQVDLVLNGKSNLIAVVVKSPPTIKPVPNFQSDIFLKPLYVYSLVFCTSVIYCPPEDCLLTKMMLNQINIPLPKEAESAPTSRTLTVSMSLAAIVLEKEEQAINPD